MQDFRQLKVWSSAHALTLAIYGATRSFPTDERFGVVSQIRRAAVSIATNVAEGCGRGSDADFARFLQMAMGSASEVEYLLTLSRDLKYLSAAEHVPLEQQTGEVKRMLTALMKRLKADS